MLADCLVVVNANDRQRVRHGNAGQLRGGQDSFGGLVVRGEYGAGLRQRFKETSHCVRPFNVIAGLARIAEYLALFSVEGERVAERIAADIAPVALPLVWDEREIGESRFEQFARRELRRGGLVVQDMEAFCGKGRGIVREEHGRQDGEDACVDVVVFSAAVDYRADGVPELREAFHARCCRTLLDHLHMDSLLAHDLAHTRQLLRRGRLCWGLEVEDWFHRVHYNIFPKWDAIIFHIGTIFGRGVWYNVNCMRKKGSNMAIDRIHSSFTLALAVAAGFVLSAWADRTITGEDVADSERR